MRIKIKGLPAFLISLGSYFPLALILVVQDVADKSWSASLCRHLTSFAERCELPSMGSPYRSIGFCVVTAVALAVGLAFVMNLKGGQPYRVVDAKPIPNDLINYVFPYVVSLMGLDVGSTGKFLGFLLFLIWMFLITYRSGQVMMNPVLFVFRWRLYELSGSFGQHARVIRVLTREPIAAGDQVVVRPIQDVHIRTS